MSSFLELSLKQFESQFVVDEKVDASMKVGTWQGKTVMVKFDHPLAAAEVLVYRKVGDHPNILSLLAVVDNGKRMVYEYPELESLEKYTPPPEKVNSALHQVAKAVWFLHSKGFVHRNLKPPCIYFTKNSEVKIGGLHTSTHPDPYFCSGKFAAPEQLTRWIKEDISPATDVFSFAMCIPYFYGIQYSVPMDIRASFDHEDYAHDDESPDSLTLPQHLVQLMKRCLWLRPVRRCTMTDIVKALAAQT